MEKSKQRLEVLEKIKQFEKEKKWNVDVENDPPSKVLMPDKVDYLNKKLSSKIARWIAFRGATKYLKKIINQKKLIVKEIVGLENLKNLKSGAIITSNHFNAMDTFAIQYATLKAGIKKEKLYRVIREGNYTNFSGFFGKLMRHCNTLPLSSNSDTMKLFLKSIDIVLKNKNFVVVYPEQAMWWNYKKPRPFQDGAFRFAVKSNVPVLPIFITMQDSNILDEDGFFIQEYTIHIFPPIYSDETKTTKQNIEEMKQKNFEIVKNCYEKTYQTKYDL